MKSVSQTGRFRTDFKRVKKRGKDSDKLFWVVQLIASGGKLPLSLKAHRLGGQWGAVWECHIEPDWLLIYSISKSEVCLIRTGTHADLFK